MPTPTGEMLCKLGQTLAEVNQEMPLQQIRLLLHLGHSGPSHSDRIFGALNMTGASLSRSIKVMGTWYEKGVNGLSHRRGMGLVNAEVDLHERRKYLYKLTPQGQALYTQLVATAETLTKG